jgi:predicted ATPase
LLEAHHALGTTCLSLAKFIEAKEHLEQGIILYSSQQHRAHAFLYGQDPGVACRRHLATVLWQLGYPKQALQRASEALSLAREIAHPPTLAGALFSSSGFYLQLREGRAAQERAEEMIACSEEQGASFMLASATIERGSALVAQGQIEEGVAQMVQAIADWQRSGGGVARLWIFSMLAEAYGKGGQVDNGLAVLAEALTFVEGTEEHYHEPELYRLKGELTLQLGTRDWGLGAGSSSPPASSLKPQVPSGVVKEAEECFFKAIDLAQKQQAKSLELRAAMSLARLWQQQGRTAEAWRMLSDIYGWFTEGFDTKDLQEAKALIEELSH